MSILQFTETDRPTDDENPFAGNAGSDDLTCEICNAPLTYSGRGRKPKYCDEHKSSKSSSTSPGKTRGSADVELAVQSLHTLYTSLTLPLMALSPVAAKKWDEEISGLDERNRLFLSTNKDLVRKINSAAAKGGSTAFVLSHLMAIGPVGAILWAEHAMRARAKRAAQEHATQESPDYADPDAAFVS